MVGLYIVRELHETKRPQIAVDSNGAQLDLLKSATSTYPYSWGRDENELLERRW